MKLFAIIFFLFLIDIYFYLGTLSIIDKFFNNTIFYKLLYWFLSISIYIVIIYVVNTYSNTTPSVRLNNNVIYSSFFAILFISKLIGSVPLIIDDVLRIFKIIITLFNVDSHIHDVKRLDFLKKSALLFSGVLFSTLLIGMKWGRYNFKKNYQDIFIKDWPVALNNYKIIHISDLHLGSFNNIDKFNEAVEMINAENADLVVFTGDLVNNYHEEAIPYIDSLKKIKSKDGKISILGNHDYCDYVMLKRDSQEWKTNFKKLLELEKESGFDLLLNESRVISKAENKFNIVGVENWGAGNFNKDGDLDTAMNIVDDSLPTILLSHDPSHWKEVVLKSDYDIDLQLSGHTHGMQFGIEIPGFKWSPAKFRYKEWAGLYKIAGNQIYVNRGLGHLGYAGRVGIMPDISVLNIRSKV
jgi:uncharacterized protein